MFSDDNKFLTVSISWFVIDLPDVFNRMNKNVMEIVRNNSGKNIVIVAHRDPIIILMAHYLGIHMDNFQRVPCAPASISIVDFHGILAEVRGVGILPSSRIEE